MEFGFSPSLICADLSKLADEIDQLEHADVSTIHFDVMDGVFVPRYGMMPEILQVVTNRSKKPVDVHMMVVDPEPYIKIFADTGATYFTVHPESSHHLSRVISKIQSAGMKPGIALNPATPVGVVEEVIQEIDLILVMGINPGIIGHKLIPSTINKIRRLAKIKGDRNIKISVDGGVTFDSAAEMINAGADLLVCGTSTIYQPPKLVKSQLNDLRRTISTNIANGVLV